MNSDTRVEPTVAICCFCNGSGEDDVDWSGRCPFCDGHGERESHEEVCNICDSGVERCVHCGGQQCACTGCGPECDG